MSWKCENCGADLGDFEPRFCCSGRDCGCMGLPIDPPICSQKCGEELFTKLNLRDNPNSKDKEIVPD